jgi:lactoylglutathione lyase
MSMFTKLGQVMLYVKDQDQSKRFWTEKAGFQVIEEVNENGMRWIEVAPLKDMGTSIVLQNKEFVEKMSPDMNLGTPSLMFYTDDLTALYKELSEKEVKVGEIVEMPFGRVFNFADDEDNYFAVREK